MDDLDALRCAELLPTQHRRYAELHTALRADELNAVGDDDGQRAWMHILAVIDELERARRHPDEVLQ